MWDCIRKCLDTIAKFMDKYPGEVEGWRKIHHWYRRMKNAMRAVGKASSSGGRNKEDRIEKAVCYYLSIARVLHDKLGKTELPIKDKMDAGLSTGLFIYLDFLARFTDQLDRRVLQGETIPHKEKVFSIFEEYTEWITKGKLHPNVELGKKLAITTDQYNLIVDYRVMEEQSDSEMSGRLQKI
jgi:IS5 family transposase